MSEDGTEFIQRVDSRLHELIQQVVDLCKDSQYDIQFVDMAWMSSSGGWGVSLCVKPWVTSTKEECDCAYIPCEGCQS